MVRNYQRKTNRGCYGTERLGAALIAVKEGMSLRSACRQFGIPARTLGRHRNNRVTSPGRVQLGKHKPVLSEIVENELYDHIKFMEKRLYGLTTVDIRKLAYSVAEHAKIDHPFNKETQMAGRDWLEGFFKRHRDLALREPEGTNLSRAIGLNRPKVKQFFDAYKELLLLLPQLKAIRCGTWTKPVSQTYRNR